MEIGKLPVNALKRSVLRQLKTVRKEVCKGAGVGTDCALLSFSEGLLLTCVQEAAVAVQTDTVSYPAAAGMADLIQRTANNLAAGGGEPVSVMIALLLPAAIEEPAVKQLMQEAEAKCREINIQIAGGQTRITDAVAAPIAVITGYGKPVIKNSSGKAVPGQDIVISKWIGLEGTAILADKYREKLLERYPAYLIDEAESFKKYLSVIPEAATAIKSGVCCMHDLSEGGIFGALWELAEGADVGLTIDLKKIPLRQETVEVCELCEVNPYELLSGGALLMTVDNGEALAEELQAQGIPACVIGRVTDSNDRIIRNEDEVRYMDRPKQDELYRKLNEDRKKN